MLLHYSLARSLKKGCILSPMPLPTSGLTLPLHVGLSLFLQVVVSSDS